VREEAVGRGGCARRQFELLFVKYTHRRG
jgi:hypothetical protein